MIGASAEHHDFLPRLPGLLQPDIRLIAYAFHVAIQRIIGCRHRLLHFPQPDCVIHFFLQKFPEMLCEVLPPVDPQIRHEQLFLRQGALDRLRIVGHHGTVVVVHAFVFIHVVGQTGIENVLHTAVLQCLDMSMSQLRRIADRVARDLSLPLVIHGQTRKS